MTLIEGLAIVHVRRVGEASRGTGLEFVEIANSPINGPNQAFAAYETLACRVRIV